MMIMADAKKLIGKTCDIRWCDRNGEELRLVSKIHDATFVPMYGGYLITDLEDVRLDRIVSIRECSDQTEAESPMMQLPVAA